MIPLRHLMGGLDRILLEGSKAVGKYAAKPWQLLYVSLQTAQANL
jgi:hypothetical protein